VDEGTANAKALRWDELMVWAVAKTPLCWHVKAVGGRRAGRQPCLGNWGGDRMQRVSAGSNES
jgi:hypothetical protein